MKQISDLLKKFQDIQSPQKEKEVIAEIINKIVGVQLKKTEIERRKKIVFIKTSSINKNEILFHQKEIIEEIKQTLNLTILSIH